jgi:hypothetical protein
MGNFSAGHNGAFGVGQFHKNYFLISALFPCAAKSPSSPLISLPRGECARKIGQRQFRVPVQPGNPGGMLLDERGKSHPQYAHRIDSIMRQTASKPMARHSEIRLRDYS